MESEDCCLLAASEEMDGVFVGPVNPNAAGVPFGPTVLDEGLGFLEQHTNRWLVLSLSLAFLLFVMASDLQPNAGDEVGCLG